MGGRAGEASVFPAEGPAGFDPAHPYADPVAAFAQREHVVREKLVKVETAKARRRERCAAALLQGSAAPCALSVCASLPEQAVWRLLQILRQRVQQCYRTEGVNHYENCREVRLGGFCPCDEGFRRATLTRCCIPAPPFAVLARERVPRLHQRRGPEPHQLDEADIRATTARGRCGGVGQATPRCVCNPLRFN